MKRNAASQIRQVDGGPARVLKGAQAPSLLPIPREIRRERELAHWRHQLWKAEHKYLVVLDPIYRELMRKTLHSMEELGLWEMCGLFHSGVMTIWFFTGSVAKAQQFIEAIFKGRVFLMFGEQFVALLNSAPDRIDLQQLVLYDPHCRPEGIRVETAWRATRFWNFVGPVPVNKPWLPEWQSEIGKVRQQAVAALGAEAAATLGIASDTGEV